MSNDKPDLRAIEQLVADLAETKARLSKVERAGRLSNAAIDAGSLTMKDENGNPVAVWDTTAGGLTVTYPTGPTPPTPSTPSVVGTPGALTVQWDGTYQDQAAAPGDLAAVQVYAAPATGLESDDPDDPVDPDLLEDDWTPDLDTLVGTIHAADGGTVTAVVDPGDYDVHLVAVALSGASSDPTAATPVTVPSLAEDPELDAALTELDEQLANAATDLARVSGLYTTSTSAPTSADGEGKPDGAWWVQIDATGAQVGTWAWSEATGAWTATPLTPQQIPALDVGKLVASSAEVDTAVINKIWAKILTVRDLIADAINGKTITGNLISGAQIEGSTFGLTGSGSGSGSGSGYDIRLDRDSNGAFLGFAIPGQITEGTIRAFDNDPNATPGNPTLVIRPPSNRAYTSRTALRIFAGTTSGGLSTTEVGKLAVIGELWGRHANGTRTSIKIQNTDTDNGNGNSVSIQSLGTYSKTASGATPNMFVSPSGYFYRAVSTADRKLSIEDIPKEQLDAILDVKPKQWFDRGQAERLAEYETLRTQDCQEAADEYAATEDVPCQLHRIPGALVEDVQAAGADAFLSYDYDCQPNGIQWDGVVSALLHHTAKQRDQIKDLTARLDALEKKVQA